MNITLVPLTKDYLIPADGRYLVRTESVFKKKVQYVDARCKRTWNEKKGVFVTSIDVTNQTVTHISAEPLNL